MLSFSANRIYFIIQQVKEPLHLYQIWISPSRNHLEPTYSRKKFEASSWENRLLPLASGQGFEDALKINADAIVYRASLEKRLVIHFDSKESRFVFIYVSAGEFSVKWTKARAGDQVRLDEERAIHLKTVSCVEFVLIDIPANRENI